MPSRAVMTVSFSKWRSRPSDLNKTDSTVRLSMHGPGYKHSKSFTSKPHSITGTSQLTAQLTHLQTSLTHSHQSAHNSAHTLTYLHQSALAGLEQPTCNCMSHEPPQPRPYPLASSLLHTDSNATYAPKAVPSLTTQSYHPPKGLGQLSAPQPVCAQTFSISVHFPEPVCAQTFSISEHFLEPVCAQTFSISVHFPEPVWAHTFSISVHLPQSVCAQTFSFSVHVPQPVCVKTFSFSVHSLFFIHLFHASHTRFPFCSARCGNRLFQAPLRS